MDLVAIVALLLLAAVATVVGVWFGIVVVAPRLTRQLDRSEPTNEEPVDQPD